MKLIGEMIMKKNKLFFFGLCVLLTAINGLCTQVDRSNGYNSNDRNKAHLQTSIDETSHTLKISAADLNITDDFIVEAIKHPHPLSVSEALESIQAESLKSTETSFDVDLSSNTICDQGAKLIGDYFKNNNTLRVLDLSWNRMTDEGIMYLVNCLKPILLQSNFKTLDIKGNYGANTANINKILSLFLLKEQEEIRTKINI